MAGHGRASVSDMKRVEVAVLLRVSRDEGKGDGRTHLSASELSRALGVTEYRTRAAIARLVERGELISEPCVGRAGNRTASALTITPAGHAFLKEIFKD